MPMNADELYAHLRGAADLGGFVSNEADLLLQQVADAIANDPRNEEEEDDLRCINDMTEEAQRQLFLDAMDKDD